MSAIAVILAAAVSAGGLDSIPEAKQKQIREAAPEKSQVKPKAARKVLVWITPPHLMDKDPHKGYCIPYGAFAFRTLGEKTGAYQPVVGDDLGLFHPDRIKQFDAIIFNNTSGSWITPSDESMAALKDLGKDKQTVEQILRKALIEFVKGGKGIVANHYAMGGNRHWPEFREMIGASYWGHPWNEEVGVLVEEQDNPLLAAFSGKKTFRIREEIFQFNKPYSRDKLRVLLSLDTATTNMGVKWIHREDNDFALAWVKSFGKGRIFYTAFGHRTEIYWNPVILRFYLDAVQFACGDLDAPVEPRKERPDHPAPGPTPPEVRRARMDAKKVRDPKPEEIERIKAAAPAKAPAKPAKKRRILVWGHDWTHQPNAFAAKAIEILGKKTGAFESVITDDPRLLLGDRLGTFDALVMNNIHEREPFLPADFNKLGKLEKQAARKFSQAVKKSILEFVASGKGVVGTHAATAACQNWPEYGKMMGGYYGGHIMQEVVVRPEDPDHPLNACFKGKSWKLRDEVYIFREPYSRSDRRVLLSLDLGRMKDPGKREDKDYAVSWIKAHGKGRVFYFTLGHCLETHWDSMFLSHLLAGIQFATGDLPAPAGPATK